MGSPYQSQSASSYNASPPPDDGSQTASNKITWAGIKTKLGDPVKALADAINTALRAALNVSPSTTSVNYTTVVGDHLTTIECSGSITISLGDAATMVAQSVGYTVSVYNKGTGTVTAALATAANTLAGQANGTVTLAPGQAMTFTVAQSVAGYDIVSATGFSPFVLTGAAGTNTATANAPSNLIALYSGLVVAFTPANTNTGATTLNITPSGGSALTAKNVFSDNAACIGGELKASVPVLLQYDGTQFQILGRRFFKQPTRQTFTTGSGTYTTPAGCTRIYVRLVGPGGGGGATATNAGANGSAATTFSTLSGGAGNGGGTAGAQGGTGGAASGGSINIPGGSGGGGVSNASASVLPSGGMGAASPFGGAGGGQSNAQGLAASANSGSGGGGGGGGASQNSGGGGGAGGYVEAWITAPAATYSYAVGAKGAGGAAGTFAGGNGADGLIIVDEYYQ